MIRSRPEVGHPEGQLHVRGSSLEYLPRKEALTDHSGCLERNLVAARPRRNISFQTVAAPSKKAASTLAVYGR